MRTIFVCSVRQRDEALLTHNNFGDNTWSAGIACAATNGGNQGIWTCSSFTNTVNIMDSTGKVVTIFRDINISILPGDPFSNMDKDSGNALIVDAQVFAK